MISTEHLRNQERGSRASRPLRGAQTGWAGGFLLIAALLAARPASGQPSKGTRAEVVFREGREAAAKGDMETACARFEESVRLARAAGPLLNMADCEERRGRLASAAKLWRDAIERLDAGDDRLPFAKQRAEALDKRLPRITVRVSPAASGAQVAIDGGDAAPLEAGAPQPVDPGTHKIVVTAGARSGRADVSIAEGERKEVSVTLGPEAPQSGAPAAGSTGGSSTTLRTAGIIAGGVGVAGLAVFGVTAGLMAGHNAAVKEGCDASKYCTREGLDAAEAGSSLAPVNTIGLVVGILGVGGGLTLFLLSPGPSKPATALRAGATAGGAWASVEGTF